MTETSRGRIIAASAAGLVTFLVTFFPSALLVAIIALGALGEADYARLGPAAVLGFVAIAVFAGYLVHRGLSLVRSEPGRRRPADVWIAFVVFLTILLVGVILIPVLIVFIAVDSDHGLTERELLVEVLWYSAHLALVALAWMAARSVANTDRPDPLDSR
jgi:hypothetical protein